MQISKEEACGISEKLDIVYLLDMSRHVSEAQLAKVKDYVKGSLSSYKISAEDVRVSIVPFGGSVSTAINFAAGVSPKAANFYIDTSVLIGGDRNLNQALSYLNSDVFVTRSGSRPMAKKVVILITTGQASDDDKLVLPATATLLKSQGVRIIVVGIGMNTIDDTLTGVATDGDHIITIIFENLPDTIGDLEQIIGELSG